MSNPEGSHNVFRDILLLSTSLSYPTDRTDVPFVFFQGMNTQRMGRVFCVSSTVNILSSFLLSLWPYGDACYIFALDFLCPPPWNCEIPPFVHLYVAVFWISTGHLCSAAKAGCNVGKHSCSLVKRFLSFWGWGGVESIVRPRGLFLIACGRVTYLTCGVSWWSTATVIWTCALDRNMFCQDQAAFKQTQKTTAFRFF